MDIEKEIKLLKDKMQAQESHVLELEVMLIGEIKKVEAKLNES